MKNDRAYFCMFAIHSLGCMKYIQNESQYSITLLPDAYDNEVFGSSLLFAHLKTASYYSGVWENRYQSVSH